MMHIGRRVIEAERYVRLRARGRELRHDVLAVRSVSDFVIRVSAVEHAESIVVLRGKNNILLPCGARQFYKSACLKGFRVETLWQFHVFRLSDAARLRRHDWPRGLDAGQRVRPPVNEHAELSVAVPGGAFIRED